MATEKPPASRKPSYIDFDKKRYAWRPDVDYKKNPEKYKVGKGEQGVLICLPYKTEIGQYWRFKTPEIATISNKKILALFQKYLRENDFVSADLARKFLQMGYTRSRLYANYKGGSKYDIENNFALKERGTGDEIKAISASIFYEAWQKAEADKRYIVKKTAWKEKYG